MPCEAVIFDMDGTILNTLKDLRDATNASLAAFGFPPRSQEEIRRFVGNGVEKLMERALPGGRNHPDFPACLAFFLDYYPKHANDSTCPYDGVEQVLSELRRRRIHTAVVSNKIDRAVKDLAHRYFGDAIEYALGDQPSLRRKPAPDAVLAVMSHWNLAPEECLFVGDSETDVQTAQNAGIPCLSVLWGFRSKEELTAAGATAFIATPDEILSYIG